MPELHDVFATKEGLDKFNAAADVVRRMPPGDVDGGKEKLRDLLLAVKELGAVVPMREAEAIAAECVNAFKTVVSDGPAGYAQYINHIQILSEEIKRSVALFLSDGAVETDSTERAEQRQREREERELADLRERARQAEQKEAFLANKLKEERARQEQEAKEQQALKQKEKELLQKTRPIGANTGVSALSESRPAPPMMDLPRSLSALALAHGETSISPTSPTASAQPAIVRARETATPGTIEYGNIGAPQGAKLVQSKSTLQDQLMAMKQADANKAANDKASAASSSTRRQGIEEPTSHLTRYTNNESIAKRSRHVMDDYEGKSIFTVKKCRNCKDLLLPGQKVLKCSACGMTCHAACFTSQMNDLVQCKTEK